MASTFIYPRTVAITRPVSQTAIGAVGYGGVTKASETPVLSGLQASIQAKSGMSRTPAGSLPAAAPGPIQWNILLPRNLVAKGIIQDRDIVTDDNGDRYQIEASYWSPMGYKLVTIRLEAR